MTVSLKPAFYLSACDQRKLIRSDDVQTTWTRVWPTASTTTRTLSILKTWTTRRMLDFLFVTSFPTKSTVLMLPKVSTSSCSTLSLSGPSSGSQATLLLSPITLSTTHGRRALSRLCSVASTPCADILLVRSVASLASCVRLPAQLLPS